MIYLLRHGNLFPSLYNSLIRSTRQPVFTSVVLKVKQIRIQEDENLITVEGIPIESDRKDHLIKLPSTSSSDCACTLCKLDLKRLEYSDVLILSQFTDSNGKLMPQPDTGLCNYSYKKVKNLVNQAHSARLLPRPPDYQSYGPWDELNHYYEFPRRIRDLPKTIIRKKYWR